MNVAIKRLRELIFLCTCLKIDGHIYQLVAQTFFDVPNYLQVNLVNDRPLSLVDLDAT